MRGISLTPLHNYSLGTRLKRTARLRRLVQIVPCVRFLHHLMPAPSLVSMTLCIFQCCTLKNQKDLVDFHDRMDVV